MQLTSPHACVLAVLPGACLACPSAVVTEAAVHGLSSPLAFVAAIACSLAGLLLRVTAAAGS